MEFEILDLNPTKKTISFKFCKEEIEKERDEVVKEIKKIVRIPGFRPGKVPPEIIKLRFKKEIEEKIIENLTNKNLEELKKQKNLKIIGDVILKETSFEDDYFKSEVEFHVLPNINLPKLTDIEIKKEEIEISEEEIDKEIEKIKTSKAKMEDSEGPIQEEKYAFGKLIGKVEGEEKEIDFGYRYIAPSGDDPVLEFLGKNVGDEVYFTKEFPQDDPSPYRGKKVNFKMKIEGIKKLELPEINEEFIKKEFPGIGTIEELRNKIKDELKKIKEEKSKEKIKEELINQLLAKTDVAVPEPILEEEIKRYLYKTSYILSKGNYDLNKINFEDLAKEYEPKAIKKLQKELLLLAFAEEYKVEVPDEEVLKKIRKICEDNKWEYEEKIKEFKKSGYYEEIKNEILIEKTFDLLMEKLGLQK